jgi:hypothetical protein
MSKIDLSGKSRIHRAGNDFRSNGAERRRIQVAISSLVLVVVAIGARDATLLADEMRLAVRLRGGHQTDSRDHGRPVVLVAAGLGVKPEVFREAFKGVTPARGGPPTPDQVQRNKRALLDALSPYGVTNERLDEVSDCYRYRPGQGRLWRTRPAKAYAIVEGGKIKQIVVTDPGSGYSSPPEAAVEGMESTALTVKLRFCADLKKNGSVLSIEISDGK